MKPFVAATRFWESREGKRDESLAKISGFIASMLEAGAGHVFVAVNTAEDKIGTVDMVWPNATVFGVEPWGFFVNPLNSILIKARPMLETHNLLLASAEVRVTLEGVEVLSNLMDQNTLVAGAALEGHLYEPGIHESANGRQIPWNTLSMWNPIPLWVTGFPLLGEGPISEPDNKGVEEVMAGAVIQALYPEVKIYLAQIPGQVWDTSGFDQERLAAHEKKMASKVTRPARQLEVANMTGPTVIHV